MAATRAGIRVLRVDYSDHEEYDQRYSLATHAGYQYSSSISRMREGSIASEGRRQPRVEAPDRSTAS